jgi:hypothetical protein
MMVDMGASIETVGILLVYKSDDIYSILHAITFFKAMVKQKGSVQILCWLISVYVPVVKAGKEGDLD